MRGERNALFGSAAVQASHSSRHIDYLVCSPAKSNPVTLARCGDLHCLPPRQVSGESIFDQLCLKVCLSALTTFSAGKWPSSRANGYLGRKMKCARACKSCKISEQSRETRAYFLSEVVHIVELGEKTPYQWATCMLFYANGLLRDCQPQATPSKQTSNRTRTSLRHVSYLHCNRPIINGGGAFSTS
jgi:hypothetical protein